MRINIRADSVTVEGYVNAVERYSKTLHSRLGKFIERIRSGAFSNALKRNDDVHVLLNHDWSRDLGSTKKGNLELAEDAIGLRAKLTTDDPEVIEDAKEGRLVGWSFGFRDRDVDTRTEDGMAVRDVKDLDLYEVSLLNNKRSPAYSGTLVMVRDDGSDFIGEDFVTEIEVIEERSEPETVEDKAVDYSEYEVIVGELKELRDEETD